MQRQNSLSHNSHSHNKEAPPPPATAAPVVRSTCINLASLKRVSPRSSLSSSSSSSKARSVERWRTSEVDNPPTSHVAARRQIFLPSHTSSLPTVNNSSYHNHQQHQQSTMNHTNIMSSSPPHVSLEEGEETSSNNNNNNHPAKRRRGTPTHKRGLTIDVVAAASGKENPTNRRPFSSSSSPTSAKSLFGASRVESQSFAPLAPLARDTDPWERVRTLSLSEQRSQYWKLCYGGAPPTDNNVVHNNPRDTITGSAQRAPPRKGCLSIFSIPGRRTSGNGKTLFVSPSMENLHQAAYDTPQTASHQSAAKPKHTNDTRSVQFGPTRAAEYESNDPALALTPMPAAQAETLYPIDIKLPSDSEVSLIQETKDNTAVLDEWDEDEEENVSFTLVQESEDSSGGEDNSSQVFRTAPARPSRKRRSSSFFVPSAGRHGLLEEASTEEDDEDDDDNDDDDGEQSDMSTDTTPPQVNKNLLTNLPRLSLDSPNQSSSMADGSMASTPSTLETQTLDDSMDSILSEILGSSTEESVEEEETEEDPNSRALVVHQPKENVWKAYVADPLQFGMRIPAITSPHQSGVWKIIVDSDQYISEKRTDTKTKNADSGNSWVHQMANVSSLVPMLERAVRQMQHNPTRSREMAQLVRLMREVDLHCTEMNTEREFLHKAFVQGNARGLRKKLNDRLQNRLEQEIQQLELQIAAETKRASLWKENRVARVSLVQSQQSALLFQALQTLAPLEADFSMDGIVKVTFDAEKSGLSCYLPGQTLRVQANSGTNLVTWMGLVSLDEDNQDDADLKSPSASSQSQRQKKCKTLLVQDLERMQERLADPSLTLDCTQMVMHWMVVLSQLERHFYSLATVV